MFTLAKLLPGAHCGGYRGAWGACQDLAAVLADFFFWNAAAAAVCLVAVAGAKATSFFYSFFSSPLFLSCTGRRNKKNAVQTCPY